MSTNNRNPEPQPSAKGARKPRPSHGYWDVITVPEAVRAIPWRDTDVREWLRNNNLIHLVNGRRVCRWGPIYDAMAGANPPPANRPGPFGPMSGNGRDDDDDNNGGGSPPTVVGPFKRSGVL